MTPKNGTNIDFTVTTAYVMMSVYNTDDEYVWTIAPFDTPKYSSQRAADTSYSSIYTRITASASTLSSSAALTADLTSSSKSHNNVESIQEGVRKTHSDCTAPVSAVSTSSEFAAACLPSSKIPKEIESIQEGVKNIC